MPAMADSMEAMDHSAMDHGSMDHSTHGALDLPMAGDTSPPLTPTDWAADQIHDPAAMNAARQALFRSTRDTISHIILLDQLEWRAHKGGDAIAWGGKAWVGGDIDRLMIRTEGEALVHGPVEKAEIRALWSHAVGPYANLELGIRYDVRPEPNRSYATVGIDAMLPYWIEAEGALFLSDKGDMLGRVELSHDMRLTNALILQPRAELNLAAQDIAEQSIGAGLSDAEFGLRLRYAPDPAFGPYIGVNWERKFGETARIALAEGEHRSTTSLVAGVRFWF